ncbi:MAG: hypothetical protein IT422_19950 [Pirellulaceae bacterium]|nr:hypothetical protein [Pirellulaceae bacterium]
MVPLSQAGSLCHVNAPLHLILGLSFLCGWSSVASAQAPDSATPDVAAVAQEFPPTPASEQSSPAKTEATAPPLVSEQKSVAERFSRLEILLLRSADLEAGENPTRAALLQQAVQLSKQAELTELLADAAARLEQGQYSEAIEKQKLSRESLKRLLELLQSENREERIREQRDEVRRWIEETDRLLRLQSSLRGRTEGGQDTEQAAQDQEKLANKAAEIADELPSDQSAAATDSPSTDTNESDPNASEPPNTDSIDPNSQDSKPSDSEPSDSKPSDSKPSDSKPSDSEPSDSKPSDSKPSDSKPSDSKPSDSKPSDSKPSDSKPSDSKPSDSKPSDSKPSDSKPSDSKPSDSKPSDSKPSDSQPSDSKPSDSKPSDSQPSDSQPDKSSEESSQQQPAPQSPTERAKQKIEQAKERMKEAEEELKQAEREGAIEKQREAEERLREAIEELEEILRQLREEEVERSLASLETRLRRMLEMQTRVLEETTRLQEITGDGSGRQVQITASKLSLDELKILAEGERALLLLREEGSSAAFPEAIEQLNVDIQSVSDLLRSADVGPLTVLIEQEIVSSLEEMVEALVQVQKENREKQQQQQPGQQPPGEPGDQPLVDKLAELRLIRTLQVRINNRTNTLSKMLEDPADPTGQVAEKEVVEQLQSLAQRQSSIQQVTRDIVVGKGE